MAGLVSFCLSSEYHVKRFLDGVCGAAVHHEVVVVCFDAQCCIVCYMYAASMQGAFEPQGCRVLPDDGYG